MHIMYTYCVQMNNTNILVEFNAALHMHLCRICMMKLYVMSNVGICHILNSELYLSKHWPQLKRITGILDSDMLQKTEKCIFLLNVLCCQSNSCVKCSVLCQIKLKEYSEFKPQRNVVPPQKDNLDTCTAQLTNIINLYSSLSKLQASHLCYFSACLLLPIVRASHRCGSCCFTPHA